MKGKVKSKRDNRAERRQAKRRSVCAEKNAAPPASTEDVEDEDVVKAPILPPMHLLEAVNAADDKNDAPNEDEETLDDAGVHVQDFAEPDYAAKDDKANADLFSIQRIHFVFDSVKSLLFIQSEFTLFYSG